MKTNDYRATRYYSPIITISEKKCSFSKKIYTQKPDLNDYYHEIRNNYKKDFMKVYDYKCSYCGNVIDNISEVFFEIDHYIYKASKQKGVGKINNLVLACRDCNRSKSDLPIASDYQNLLNPDLENIKKVFLRNDQYYIKISDYYKEDQFINQFYNKLRLNYQTRRLDYLLMNIRGLCKKLEQNSSKGNVYLQLNTVLNKLQKKRNLVNCIKSQ